MREPLISEWIILVHLQILPILAIVMKETDIDLVLLVTVCLDMDQDLVLPDME